jgi:uncharacterized membrane protein YraQ (UPF0718 family)
MAKEQSPKSRSSKSTPVQGRSDISRWLKDTYHAVWSVVGLIIIGVVLAAVFTGNSVLDILGDSDQQPPAGQTAPPPPAGPT